MELAFNIELTLNILDTFSYSTKSRDLYLNTQVPLESHVNTKQKKIGL